MENSLEILKTIPYSQLYLWDVKRFAKSGISSKYNIVQLSNYITERNEKVKLFEFPEKEFGILGVNNKIGIFDAYREFGKNINQAYKKVENHDLAYNPYRINVGSIGWKTENQKYDFISPAYVVFKTQNGLSSEFLYRIFKTDTFNKIIRDNTTGSVRQNLKFSTLSNINIPLPPLTEQNRLVANYNAKIQLANEQEQKAKELEQEIEEYLFEVLGIEKSEEKKNVKGLQFVKFKDTSRWDTLFLIGSIPKLKSKYEMSKFSDIISYFNKNHNNESIRINSKDFPDEDFYYIGMEHIEKETGRLLELKKVKGKEIKSQTLKVPKDFILFGKLRPYLNKYWINNTNHDNIICSSEFFVFDVRNEIIKNYFLIVLSSQLIQNQISDKTSGARMPRINEEIFFNLQFPVPPLKIQTQIANHITGLKQQIKDLKSQAEENREKAIKEFENEIFIKN